MTGVPRFDPTKPFEIEGAPRFDPSRPFTVEDAPIIMPPPEKPAPPLLETGKQALSNLPSSALEFGKSLVHPILHPVETATNLKDLGLGIIQKIRNLSPERLRGTEPAFDEATANAVGQHFTERYGDWDSIQKTIAKDPVGAAADLSMVLTAPGAAAAKLPGTLGKAGSVVEKTGRAIDPVNAAATAVTTAAKVAEPIASGVVGLTTGAGQAPIREAAKAGFEGGAKQTAFLDHMRGKAPIAEVVDTAKAAIEEMREKRGDAYRAGMAGVTKDPAILDFKPIDAALQKMQATGTFDGKVVNQSAVGTWEKINAAVEEWRAADPAKNHTVEGMDALKRKIGDIRDSTDFGKPERTVADKVYQAVRNQIVAQAPDYGRVMKDYEAASEMVRDIEKSLSLGHSFSADSAVRKLQSLMRNNANTNYGRRVEQGKALETSGADDLMPMLAGQALSSVPPRGLVGQGAGLSAIGAGYLSNPWAYAAAPLASPRAVGEVAHAGGATARKAQAMADALRGYVDPTMVRQFLFQAGRPEMRR